VLVALNHHALALNMEDLKPGGIIMLHVTPGYALPSVPEAATIAKSGAAARVAVSKSTIETKHVASSTKLDLQHPDVSSQ
jgi:hypothetical protein